MLHELAAPVARARAADEYFGTLVNAWLAAGGEALGVKAGDAYVDVGTLHGYRAAIALLADAAQSSAPRGARRARLARGPRATDCTPQRE